MILFSHKGRRARYATSGARSSGRADRRRLSAHSRPCTPCTYAPTYPMYHVPTCLLTPCTYLPTYPMYLHTYLPLLIDGSTCCNRKRQKVSFLFVYFYLVHFHLSHYLLLPSFLFIVCQVMHLESKTPSVEVMLHLIVMSCCHANKMIGSIHYS